ncbi:DUF5060 domain-containing protein [Paenibacillus sp. N4]|uniref:DUF5060 domain-containing protein n=1 Tax=Paenibacillus vietnamensis TaxID=2590547 RepID=UPI001CD0EE03|nr:DUF5060 domain-containing protein [Paenibacillus vietnamensis]MCA0755818.1 DUF5060 domain-containing protein [Paenibacillus vietnamensis]
MKITKDTKIGNIWSNEHGRSVILKHTREIEKEPLFIIVQASSLAEYAADKLVHPNPGKWLSTILKELESVDLSRKWEKEITPSDDYEDLSVEIGSAALHASVSAEKWTVFELELHGPCHGNPYIDVDLGAQFTCDGQSINVRGFYDGDGVYRVRFMPNAEGEWIYRTTSNSRTLNGLEGRFACTPAQEGNHGPVRVADTFHFAYEDGTRYLPVGTTCYVWNHQPEELEEQTLATLAQSAFNKIRMCVFPKSFIFNENEPPRYPFPGSIEEGWDFTRFNPEFFHHLERRIADLGRLGIEADIILFHPYDRWGFSTMDSTVDARYLKYMTARLSAFRNVWWSLANEYELLWDKPDEDWERFGQIVSENDPYGHLISIHNFVNVFDQSRPWITHCSLQKSETDRSAEWRKQWNKPIVIDECAYEGNISPFWGNITGEDMVRRFWEAALRGGYAGHGETYLDPGDILWWSKGGILHGSSPERIKFLKEVIEESPSSVLNPLMTEFEYIAGNKEEFYLYYFSSRQPCYYDFAMTPGLSYRADIIDTWNMSVEELEGSFEGNFQIKLPGRPYIAVRLTRI